MAQQYPVEKERHNPGELHGLGEGVAEVAEQEEDSGLEARVFVETGVLVEEACQEADQETDDDAVVRRGGTLSK